MSRTRPRTAFDLNEVSRVVGPVAAGRSGPKSSLGNRSRARSADGAVAPRLSAPQRADTGAGTDAQRAGLVPAARPAPATTAAKESTRATRVTRRQAVTEEHHSGRDRHAHS